MAKKFALVFGIIYTIVGILGFIPAALTPLEQGAPEVAVNALEGRLLGLFPVNVLHDIVHLAIGIWGLVASRTWNAAIGFARGLTIIYVVLAIFGLFPVLKTTFGLIPLYSHDIWLHAVSAAVAAYFGWFVEKPRHEARSGAGR